MARKSVVQEGRGRLRLPGRPELLRVSDDTVAFYLLAKKAKSLDGSRDFPLLNVGTGRVNSVKPFDGLLRETFFLEGWHHLRLKGGQLVLVYLHENGGLKRVVELGTINFSQTAQRGL